MGNGSHIRIPRCVLKQFENEKHTLYQWNFSTGLITKGRSASINTEEGYYSQETEHFLRDQVEAPFGKLMAFIKGIDKESPRFTLSVDVKNAARLYAYALVARSEQMMEYIADECEDGPPLTKQQQHDLAVSRGLQRAQKQNFLGNCEFTFLANHTSTPFVLPLCGSYSYSYDGDIMIGIPFTPNYAITFMDRSVAYEKYIVGDTMPLFQVVSESEAMDFNRLVLASERKDGNKGIVASTEDVLVRLKMAGVQ